MALGAMLAQEVENLERAIYYISKKLLAYEENYSLIERTCLAVSLKLVEVQSWKMYFDGAMNKSGAGIGVVLEAQNGEQLLMSKRLCFPTTNNIAEYEACICGLEALIAVGAKKVEVFGDSMLVVSHVKGEWELKEEKLRPYLEYAKKLLFSFEEVTMKHMPRAQNQIADALAMLASLWEKGDRSTDPIILMRSRIPCYEGLIIAHLDLEDEMKWYEDIRRYLEVREYPQSANSRDRATIHRLATQFTLAGGQLYKRFFEGLLLLCVTKSDASK
ncbi:hypothetical protein P3X46_025922 [Hevea brasiliensis]|uniref:RNase H type-1 domain-containing protein n=2 Tax=Hevea brasiliensis TaxID=3981 RepID=A0ABQ9KV03_HEVBR|nr:hypothetical protein P3X46_025922 [Hevea brasiliensis]